MAYDPTIVIDNKHRLQGKGFEPGKPVGFDEHGNLVNVDAGRVDEHKLTIQMTPGITPSNDINISEGEN